MYASMSVNKVQTYLQMMITNSICSSYIIFTEVEINIFIIYLFFISILLESDKNMDSM